eukprot:1148170-Pelagomonas_calceolata.AAC.1
MARPRGSCSMPHKAGRVAKRLQATAYRNRRPPVKTTDGQAQGKLLHASQGRRGSKGCKAGLHPETLADRPLVNPCQRQKRGAMVLMIGARLGGLWKGHSNKTWKAFQCVRQDCTPPDQLVAMMQDVGAHEVVCCHGSGCAPPPGQLVAMMQDEEMQQRVKQLPQEHAATMPQGPGQAPMSGALARVIVQDVMVLCVHGHICVLNADKKPSFLHSCCAVVTYVKCRYMWRCDVKCRYMWRCGPRPEKTAFPELNAQPVIPE